MTIRRTETFGSWATLYLADSAEILDTLRAHEPDAVIMDPPYGIGLHNAGYKRKSGVYAAGMGAEERRGNTRIAGDRDGVDIRPWLDIAPQALTWGADHLRRYLPEGGRFLAWDKLAGMRPWDSFSDVEFAWHSRASKATVFSMLWKGIACDKRGESNGFRHHPMQKPIRVMAWCIEQCRLERGATILDPYMGSGTTGIAAFGADMRFVGVEIEERWFDAACERIARQCDEGLFA